MMDLGPQVLAACKKVDLPCYRGAWTATAQSPKPPPVYAVFTTVDSNGRSVDDRVISTRHFIYLNIYAEKQNPRAVAGPLVEELAKAGIAFVDGRDDFAETVGSHTYAITFFREVWA